MAKKPKTTKNNGQLTVNDELASLLDRLNKKREYIAILELELFNTRGALHEFSLLYNKEILPLEQKLRELRRLLYESVSSKQNGDNDAFDFSIDDEEDPFTYQDQEENGNGWRQNAKPKKAKNPQLEEKIKKLFRELAKRFHPDLTCDPEEKAWREKVMTQVNQAYTNRDIKSLQALFDQPDRPVKETSQNQAERINAMRTELLRLDDVIADLKARIRHLEESPVMQLKLEARMQRRSGSDLLTEMKAKIQKQIDDLSIHLEQIGVLPADQEDQDMPEKQEEDQREPSGN